MNGSTTLGLVLVLALTGCSGSESPEQAGVATDVATVARTVEVACGSCIYDMPGVDGCVLAASIDGKPMLITGVDVDAHEHGLCSGSKQALIAGTVEGDDFVATSVEIQ